MKRFLLFVVATAFTFNVNAQEAKGTIHTAPLAGVGKAFDGKGDYNAQVFNLEAPSPDGNADKIRLQKAKEEVAKRFPYQKRTSVLKTTAAKEPVVTASFDAQGSGGVPPDNDVAVSVGGKTVSVINSTIAYLESSTGVLNNSSSLGWFARPAGENGMGDNKYDPKILYDSKKDRFICIMLNGRDQYNYVIVGFSMSNNPQGTWAFYKFYGDYKMDSTWFDYPGVALTNDELFITGNKIKYSAPWETGFTETVIYQINKQNGYDSAASLTYKTWDGIQYGGKSIRNLFPVKPGWEPETDEQYFVSNRNFDVQNDTIFLVKVPGKISAGGSISTTVLTSPTKYGVPPNGKQPDTSVELATNDGRILGAYAMYDEIQFVSTSVHPVNGRAAVYHAKIKDYKTNPQISHVGFFTVDTLDFGYPNISYVGTPWGLNQSIISFNYTGPNRFPGMAAIMYDGLSYSNMVNIKSGNSSIKIISGKQQRWGDYMGSQVDYTSKGAVWLEGIYGKTGSYPYGNFIARLNSPSLTIGEVQKGKLNQKLYPNPVLEFTSFEFTLIEERVMTFEIYNTVGQIVGKIITQKCKKGRNMIRFNTASLPTGSYILKGTSSSADVLMSERFNKQ